MTMLLYTEEQIRAIDCCAIKTTQDGAYGLMQKAAKAVFHRMQARWPETRQLIVCCGFGNNGGDGWLLAHQAQLVGIKTQVWVSDGKLPKSAEALRARELALASGVVEHIFSLGENLPKTDLVIDALFGVGLRSAPDAKSTALIDAINRQAAPVLSIDIPSGLDADRGSALGACVRANVTVTLIRHKRGLWTGYGPVCAGSVDLETLETDSSCAEGLSGVSVRCVGAQDVKAALKPRLVNAHKGHHGHVLVIGGGIGMGGAALLAASAAARVGAGWVSVATRSEHVGAILSAQPELMVLGVEQAHDIDLLLARASVIALGPGLGQSAWAQQLFEHALHTQRPVVIDADALNWLAKKPVHRSATTVLTPHPGEAARLLECSVADIEHDRYQAALMLAHRYQAVVVLKGAGTIIATAQEKLSVCPVAYAGMASAGMGDVLTGVIAGLIAQGLSVEQAAEVGVWVHAHAALRAGGSLPRGLMASDVIRCLPMEVNP